jgi:hypothetical protein
MRIIPKDTDRIRGDALKTMRRNAENGCQPCAQRYEAIARSHGATDKDVSIALSRPLEPRPTRRTLLGGALAVAASAGVAGPGLLRQTAALAFAPSVTLGAWTVGADPLGSPPPDRPVAPTGPYVLSAVNTGGTSFAEIRNVVNTVVRTRDGHLVIVAPQWRSTGFASRCDLCDANSGEVTATVMGSQMEMGADKDAVQHIEPYLSPDGNYLALVRMQYEIARQPTIRDASARKPAVRERRYRCAVELISLNSNRSVGMLAYGDVPGNQPSGENLAWATDSSRFFTFSRRFMSTDFVLTVSAVAATGGGPELLWSKTGVESGPTRGVFVGQTRFPQRITPDGKRLVRYTPGRVSWYGLRPWQATGAIDRPVMSGFGKHPPVDVAVFTTSADFLYLANPSTGDVAVVDCQKARVLRSITLPRRPRQSGQPREPVDLSTTRNLAALSSDETTLYVADNRGVTGGAWAIDTRRMTPVGFLFDGHPISAVVADGSGGVLALSRMQRRIHTSDGASGETLGTTTDFIRAGSCASGE